MPSYGFSRVFVATRVKFSRGFAGSSVERVSASGLRPTPKHPPHAGREMKLLVPSAVIYIENAENEMTENLIFCIGISVLLSSFLSSVGLSFLVFFFLKQKININIKGIQLISVITILLLISILYV